MSDNIQTNITGRLTPCLQKKIDKTTYLVEVHFSATSTQSVTLYPAFEGAKQAKKSSAVRGDVGAAHSA